MKKMKLAILGFGQRGYMYANIIKRYPEEMELGAVCEINPVKKPFIMNMYNVKEEDYYTDYRDMFKQGKIADILVISTMDQDHYDQAMAALDLGYDILLEKPIAAEIDHCIQIRDKANELGRKVAVCHVLRYTPFYQKIKDIVDAGKIGKIMTLSQTEHIGYYHYAHSYVRGNWRRAETSAPMILAKACHDLDIIRWLIGEQCEALSSFGNLSYFKQENAPAGSADYCYKCEVECPYNAIRFYNSHRDWFMIFSLDPDVDKVLRNEAISYGRCVYRSDNNVADHQVVNMLFAAGATASLTVTAFSNEIHRSIKIHGTKGEIEGDLEKMEIIVKRYGGEIEIIDVKALASDFSGHGGGDVKMVVDFVRNLREGKAISGLTDINNSIESHRMAFAAEASRRDRGKVIKL
ncbi:MAG: Gfo/Idh/MocA family oxidoreductase [Bacilli bacterium]|nr:Gfo/Idh/MocA family oxidoreductase [Bacilli bacterium]MDD4077684.1 Gfo/Idh/MocA family oxidoreductase [Bacilli bacterium]